MGSLFTLTSLIVPLILAAAALLVFGHLWSERDLTRRINTVVHSGKPGSGRNSRTLLVSLLSQLGGLVQQMSVLSKADLEELDRAARSAGFAPETAVPIVIGGKLVLIVTCPLVAFLLTRHLDQPWPLAATCAGMVLGLFGPNFAISHARNARKKALRLGLSDALDLLVVCAEAGLSLESAIDRVSMEMKSSNPEVADEFNILGQDLRLSADRGTALIRMGERIGLEGFQRMTSTLAQTLRYGTPLGQALRLLASEMRNDRLLRLEEKAAKLPTLLTIPLAVFILPCLFIVVAGPAMLRVIRMMN